MLTISVRVEELECLVVGGGAVAERRILKVLEAGGRVHVLSPMVTPTIRALADEGKVQWTEASYVPGELPPAQLVWVVTDNVSVNEQASEEAIKRGSLVNRADDAERSLFTMPATTLLGELELFVSTGGASPRLNRLLRADMEARYASVQSILPTLRRIRDEVKQWLDTPKERETFWQTYLTPHDVELLLKGRHKAVEEKLQHAVYSIRAKSQNSSHKR